MLRYEVKVLVMGFLTKVVELLKNDVVEVSIYGSAARSEMRESSDLDVLIMVKGSRKHALKALENVYTFLGDSWLDLAASGCVLELTLVGEKEWNDMLEKSFSFPCNVEREKIVLYRGS